MRKIIVFNKILIIINFCDFTRNLKSNIKNLF